MRRGLVLLALLASACADDTSNDDETPVVHPLPGELADIDLSYLPYEYVNDGCEYRSSYLGMELLARGMPSFVVAAEDCELELALQGPAGERWRFHESVVVWDGETPRIVEPLLSPEYLSTDEWLDGFAVEPVNVYLSEVGNPPSYQRQDSKCEVRADLKDGPRKIEDMQPWSLANAMIFCSYMRRHLLDSPLYDEKREEQLVARTHELLEVLEDHGLLMDDDPEARQHLAEGPWCPPPIPKK